uniref:terminase large subunit domain-containing protein n=1 Tax=Leuconostoc lactis TaxID=1246 RepID=UPI00289B4F3C
MATVKRLDLTKKGMSLDKAYRDEDYTQVWDNFLDPATQYARKVLNKEIVAGYKLRLSAFRHVRDIQRSQEDDGTFPYYYDLTVAQKVMLFALSTPNPDTGKPVDLMPWQWYLLLVSKAWRRKDDPNQARFRTGIISVARGQGKTMLEAILMLYSFIIEGDGLSNQDYLVTAPTAVQLTKIWDYMISTANLMRETKEFKPYFTRRNILVQETSIRSVKDRSKIIKISDESGRFESFHASYGVGDEYGETDGQNAGKITSGMMLSGGQFMMISTAKD